MTEFKIDPNKYAGMSPEEADRAMEEDRRKAIAEDPRTQAAIRGQRERQEAREAEEVAAQAFADMERRDASVAELESYRERRLQAWVAQGGLEEHFEEVWPEVRKEVPAGEGAWYELQGEAPALQPGKHGPLAERWNSRDRLPGRGYGYQRRPRFFAATPCPRELPPQRSRLGRGITL